MLHSECKWRHKECLREIKTQVETGANVWKPDSTAKLRNSVYLEDILALYVVWVKVSLEDAMHLCICRKCVHQISK